MAVLKQGVFFILLLVPSLGRSRDSLDAHKNRDLLPTSVCGTNQVSAVPGAEQVTPGEYPWLALIQYRKGDSKLFLCGGFLINKRYVLTAANCLHRGTIKDYVPNLVRLGEYDTTTDPDKSVTDPVLDFGIEQQIIHEEYSSTQLHNNIGLIRLDGDVPVTAYVRPICLPSPEDDRKLTTGSSTLEEVGWGITANNPRKNVPERIRLHAMDADTCADIYNKVHRIVTSGQVCAGGDGKSTDCVGESGSPLMGYNNAGRYVALGITSYGPRKCNVEGIPTVYTRVSAYLDWILDHMSP